MKLRRLAMFSTPSTMWCVAADLIWLIPFFVTLGYLGISARYRPFPPSMLLLTIPLSTIWVRLAVRRGGNGVELRRLFVWCVVPVCARRQPLTSVGTCRSSDDIDEPDEIVLFPSPSGAPLTLWAYQAKAVGAALRAAMQIEEARAARTHIRRGHAVDLRDMTHWRSVPDAARDAWSQAFAVPGGAAVGSVGVDVAMPCPVCGEARLHRYYQRGVPLAAGVGAAFVARGALWEWCSACRCYEHASALVPAWWRCDLAVDEGELTALPDVLEAALRGRDGGL